MACVHNQILNGKRHNPHTFCGFTPCAILNKSPLQAQNVPLGEEYRAPAKHTRVLPHRRFDSQSDRMSIGPNAVRKANARVRFKTR